MCLMPGVSGRMGSAAGVSHSSYTEPLWYGSLLGKVGALTWWVASPGTSIQRYLAKSCKAFCNLAQKFQNITSVPN